MLNIHSGLRQLLMTVVDIRTTVAKSETLAKKLNKLRDDGGAPARRPPGNGYKKH